MYVGGEKNMLFFFYVKWPDHLGDLAMNGGMVLGSLGNAVCVDWILLAQDRVQRRSHVNIHTTPLTRYHGVMLRYRYSFGVVLIHKVRSAQLCVPDIP